VTFYAITENAGADPKAFVLDAPAGAQTIDLR
jgi:outer membrane lipoprotein-sorting protein